MTAVIIAGGKGERLKTLFRGIPKPMVEIAGKPVLEHQINLLRSYGITDIHILTGYLGHVIRAYFKDGRAFGVNITFHQEETPLGTAGCLKGLEGILNSDVLVFYGDVILDFKIDDLIAFHHKKSGSGTLVAHPNDHPYDSDLVVIDDNCRIINFLLKSQKPAYYENLASAAVYILSPEVFRYIPEGESDFVSDIFPAMLNDSMKLYAYKTAEYIKDMGTINRLEEVNNDFKNGKVQRLSKKNKRAAIFFDRDGTLVKGVELLHRVEDLELFPFSSATLRKVNKSDFLCFLVTNQPVVARSICDVSMVKQIHNKLETLLGLERAYLNDIYFCPHHPDKGYPEENPVFKIECDCRKPKTGMMDRAVKEYNIDIRSSWVIGDTITDIQTGINAGLKTVLVRTGDGGKDKKFDIAPDFIFDDIEDAVDFILFFHESKII